LIKNKKRVAIEQFFSRFKEYLDLKKQGIYGKKNVMVYTYFICIGMLIIGYINQCSGYSPCSVKIFLRKFT